MPMMRNWVVPLLLVAAAAGTSAQDRADGRDRFTGAWRLAWLEHAGPDGKALRVDCTGLLVYTADGHMSVQVMERHPAAAAPAGAEQYAQGGYEASWGTFRVDARAGTFTFHVDGALVRSLVGRDLVRAYEFTGRQLIVRSANPDEHWRVAWERVP